eukprot:223355-Prymnesium_polylepis.1
MSRNFSDCLGAVGKERMWMRQQISSRRNPEVDMFCHWYCESCLSSTSVLTSSCSSGFRSYLRHAWSAARLTRERAATRAPATPATQGECSGARRALRGQQMRSAARTGAARSTRRRRWRVPR